jgi:hypothetical protein
MSNLPLVLDDFSQARHDAARWSVFTDRVMGGVSVAQAQVAIVQGRRALRLQGQVSLANNGGFVQVARPLGSESTPLDATGTDGLQLDVCGMPGRYFVHLRTVHTRAPWQYYRAPLPVAAEWHTVAVPWSAFTPGGLSQPLDVRGLLRLGVVGGAEAFDADVALARLVIA